MKEDIPDPATLNEAIWIKIEPPREVMSTQKAKYAPPKTYLSIKAMRTSKNCQTQLWKSTKGLWQYEEHSLKKNGRILVITVSFVSF